MVGNTAQHRVSAPGSAVKRSRRLQPLGWRTGITCGSGHQATACPCVCTSELISSPPGCSGCAEWCSGAVARSDNRRSDQELGTPHQQLWNQGQRDKVGRSAVCQMLTHRPQPPRTLNPVPLSWVEVEPSDRWQTGRSSTRLSVGLPVWG